MSIGAKRVGEIRRPIRFFVSRLIEGRDVLVQGERKSFNKNLPHCSVMGKSVEKRSPVDR